MDATERQHMKENMVGLIDTTMCNTGLLTHFESQSILSDEDVQIIESKVIPSKMSRELYIILQKKDIAYSQIIKALQDTLQTGAVVILERLPTEKRREFRESSAASSFSAGAVKQTDSFKTASILVSSDDCPLQDVVNVITKLPTFAVFTSNLPSIALGLGIPRQKINSLKQQMLMGTANVDEVILEILEIWVGKEAPNNNTLGKLMVVLEKNNQNNAACALEKAFSKSS